MRGDGSDEFFVDVSYEDFSIAIWEDESIGFGGLSGLRGEFDSLAGFGHLVNVSIYNGDRLGTWRIPTKNIKSPGCGEVV